MTLILFVNGVTLHSNGLFAFCNVIYFHFYGIHLKKVFCPPTLLLKNNLVLDFLRVELGPAYHHGERVAFTWL